MFGATIQIDTSTNLLQSAGPASGTRVELNISSQTNMPAGRRDRVGGGGERESRRGEERGGEGCADIYSVDYITIGRTGGRGRGWV